MQRTDFLKAIFNDNHLIEIREIKGNKITQKFFNLEELESYKPPKSKNIYFGVFARSNKSNGKASNCTTTGALWADYDNMSKTVALYRIERAGLPKPSIVVSSGNGIHCYWILKERAGNEALGVIKAIAENTEADPKATDKARVLRLPDTMNVKSLPVECKVLEVTNKIYDLKQIADILFIDLTVQSEPKKDKKIQPIDIGFIDRHCIRSIASGVGEGERNFALGRLTKYLQTKGFTKAKAQKTILQWNKLNEPPEEESKLLKDFNMYWNEDYKLLGCSISNSDLQQLLSKHCKREECSLQKTIGGLELNNSVKYNNRMFNYFDKVTGNDLIVYGLLLRHKEGLNTDQLIEKLTSKATKKPCISNKTLLQATKTDKHSIGVIPRLKSMGLIEIKKGNRRAGIPNLYKVKLQGTYGLGYTVATNGAINGAIDGRVTAGQFKLYVLLLKYAFTKSECYPSLMELAKELKTSFQLVSRELIELEKADYIKRKYAYPKGIEKLVISLLV